MPPSATIGFSPSPPYSRPRAHEDSEDYSRGLIDYGHFLRSPGRRSGFGMPSRSPRPVVRRLSPAGATPALCPS